MIGKSWPRAVGAAARNGQPGGSPGLIAEWLGTLPSNGYSRRVALLKVVLPAIGLMLLLLVMAWPRLAPLFDRLRFAAIDLREARELRMINPRYAGTDRADHPVVITAAVGRQVPGRDDVMALDKPVANLKSRSGANIVVTADSGVYQTQTQFLDMFGHVTMTHENGTTLLTSSARLDVANNAAEGHDPVEGHGPQRDISAQGFQVFDKGGIVIFTGRSNAQLRSANAQAAPAPAAAPPEIPAPIAQAAAQLEAKAETKPAAQPAPSHAAPHRTAKAQAHPKPPAKKPG
jgi:lipopolysaccharide export system protein LptC